MSHPRAGTDYPRSTGEFQSWFQTDADCLVAIELDGRRLGSAVIAWLREVEPAWSDAYVACWPGRAGVRESRRWRGKHVLTAAEYTRTPNTRLSRERC